MMTVTNHTQPIFDRRREHRILELREDLRQAHDRFHWRLLEKELAATMAASTDERARAVTIVRRMEGQLHG